jgi:Spy/CpxP family protein refolding chaperone
VKQLISALLLTATIMGIRVPISQAQIPPFPSGQIQKEDGVPIPPGIDLTEAQKEQLKAIHASFRARLDGILTPEQRQALETARQAGKTPPEVMQSLNLSDEQKTQLQAEMKSLKSQVFGILTPEQKQKLRQLRQQQGGAPFSFIQR